MNDHDREQLGQRVLEIYGAVSGRVLLVAEAALPPEQFKAFRRLVLDEFGEQGATKQIKRLFKLSSENGKERHGESATGAVWAGASAKACKGGG